MKQECAVIIVGAGPAGIAISACLNLKNIPNIVLEKENCFASLWKHKSYDRLSLHLAKEFCQLPHMPFPTNAPTFVPKNGFVEYLENYVSKFNVSPLCQRSVVSTKYDGVNKKWNVTVKNTHSGRDEYYLSQFLIVATGENSEGFIPKIPEFEKFRGEIVHSSEYRTGKTFKDKNVLVVGCGNSGMEIAYDLSEYGANTSIVIRNPVHVLTKEMVHLGMQLLSFMSVDVVDTIVLNLAKLHYGSLSDYGIKPPSEGPFYLKNTTGRSPVLDVGTIDKIKKGNIKVLPSLKKVNGSHDVEFSNGEVYHFDAIVFATGYRSSVKKWLEEDGGLFNQDGMPKKKKPDHWKGQNGIYCAGFSSSGLFGIAKDAKNIADDIHFILKNHA